MIPGLSELIGTQYVLGGRDPAVGLDCLTCARAVYELIGRATGDPDRWRFPMPSEYSEGFMPIAAALEWYRWWQPCDYGFGAVVTLQEPGQFGLGVQIDSSRLIRAHHRAGVVLTRIGRLHRYITGIYRLRRGDPAPPDPEAEAIRRAIERGVAG